MPEKDCRKCVYFIGKLDLNPKYMWSHCKGGVSNITIDGAKTCKQYAETIKEALDYRNEEFIKRMHWEWHLKCPCCGAMKNES